MMRISVLIKRRIRLISLFLKHNGVERAEYIRKHNLFYEMGEHCYWHPYKIPHEGYCMKIHNNVTVTANVSFITHDVMDLMFNGIKCGGGYRTPI